MPLENADTIDELNEDWPLGTDTLSQGDNHIRLIKKVLKNGITHEITTERDAADSHPAKAVSADNYENAQVALDDIETFALAGL